MTATLEIVTVGPDLGERIEKQRRTATRALRRFREGLEHGTRPEPWVDVALPAALLLADVCRALGLDADQRHEVLGDAGAAFVADLQEARVSV